MTTKTTSISTVGTGRLWVAGLISVAAAVLANLIVFFVLQAALNLPAAFPPFSPVPIALFTAIGTALAIPVFALIRRFSKNPARTYWIVAMVALVVSIIPNLALMANPSGAPFPGGSAFNFGVLIVFHIVAGLASVITLTKMAEKR